MEFIPKKFHEVPINTDEENPCSPNEPEPDEEWCGILINGPQKVIIKHIDEKIFIPICGFYQIEQIHLLDSDPIKLNVIIEGQDKVLSGFVIESSPNPKAPYPYRRIIKPEDVKDQLSLSYFNPDLLEYVDIPLIEGVYHVFVEYGGMKSNIISIKVEIESSIIKDSHSK